MDSIDNSYDNAMVHSISSLYKVEVIHKNDPRQLLAVLNGKFQLESKGLTINE